MKKILIFLFVIKSFAVYTQVNRLGVISGGIGVDAGIHILGIEQSNVTQYASGDVPLLTTCFPIELNMGLVKPISVGLNISPGKWHILGEGGSVSGGFFSIGPNINLYPVNTGRFSMQFSITPSLTKFKPLSLVYDQNNRLDLAFKATSLKVRMLFNFYFSENAGMNFGIGYSSYKIGVKDYELLLSDQVMKDDLDKMMSSNFRLKLLGLSGSIGVIFRIPTIPSSK